MHSGWRRAAAAVALALGGLFLSGCDAKGTIVVQADDKLVVDLTLTGSDVMVCPESVGSLPLVIAPLTTAPGPVACRVTGTVPVTQLGQLVSLTTVREYKVMRVALQSEDSMPGGTVDLTLRFPGEVLEATSGQIAGDSVRIVDAADFDTGLEIVALNRPGPPDRVIWAAAGVVGTLLVVGAVWVIRRKRTPVPPPIDALAAGSDPLVASEEPTAAASSSEPSAPTPSAEPPMTDIPAYDHSIWAPPEDSGHGPVD